ncbi:YqaJ viral recombinase family protein [Polynucleobacter sp. MWH-UH24A]|uniref:YqaJ viral recombinase family nuclease n=1 Tax=Polynucleobacter sp. MWH-UH24A TaxID=2689110 RepID=UPI001BFD6C90|nr:YqaJ viral recombinase family protein [Polynucleobacter sp. MWH-UH24A]QWD76445.1 YqaJ viral recombinase family protein [Polynucleobacter sp. MWH-UH24A]
MLNNQDFTHNRAAFLGGSDIGAILGVSKYRSAIDVWLEKTGKRVDTKDSFAMRFGSFAESFIADEYTFLTGENLLEYSQGLVHPNYSFCVGHIDRFVLENKELPLFHSDGGLNAKKLLECKTANHYSQGDWGEPGTDAIPLPYLCQCLWYLGITNLAEIDVAVLLGGSDLRIYTITRDVELESLLFEKAALFWTEHIQKDIPPKPQSIADCQALFQRSCSGKSMEANPQTIALIQELKALESQTHAEEEQINSIKQQLMETMSDAEVLTYLGKPIITWKVPKVSYRIDTKRLGLEHPELIKAYQSPIQSSRRFVVKDLPEELMPHEPILEEKVMEGVAL